MNQDYDHRKCCLKFYNQYAFEYYDQNHKQILLIDQRKYISLISEVYLKKSDIKIKYLNYCKIFIVNAHLLFIYSFELITNFNNLYYITNHLINYFVCLEFCRLFIEKIPQALFQYIINYLQKWQEDQHIIKFSYLMSVRYHLFLNCAFHHLIIFQIINFQYRLDNLQKQLQVPSLKNRCLSIRKLTILVRIMNIKSYGLQQMAFYHKLYTFYKSQQLKYFLRIHARRHLINFIGSQIQQVFLKRQQLKMLKILLIMILFILGVFAQNQTPCQSVCVSPYYYKATVNQCCQIRWVGNNCPGGVLIDPTSQGYCVV
ncbi:hypothetical protein pb186bvf_001454 [Paramecium bursaria]